MQLSPRVTPREVGLVARSLREELGLTLKEVARIVGCDYGNLGKAERGHSAYASLAARAVERLAGVREAQAGRAEEVGPAAAVYVLPSAVADVVDRVRAPRREARRRLVAEAFEGLRLEPLDPDPPRFGFRSDRHGVVVDLDDLRVSVWDLDEVGEPADHVHVFFPGERTDEEHLQRVAGRLREITEGPR